MGLNMRNPFSILLVVSMTVIAMNIINHVTTSGSKNKELLLSPKLQLSHKADEIVDPTCSFLPDSVKDLDFPLHMMNTNTNDDKDMKRFPLIWFFDSGVMIKTEHLDDNQMGRFWMPGQKNIWEQIDEPLMMKAVADLYHRCEKEECVFVDGGAAFGYYTQMIRIHFPKVRVLAFNPHPQFVKQMIDNLSLAKVKEGVCLQQKGLSDEPGFSSMPYGIGGVLGKSGIDVQVVTLDDYYEDFGKGKLVVAIKLDIEGYGGNAMRGATRMLAAAQNVFVGLHNEDETNECHNLKTSGFSLLDESKFPMGITPNGLCVATRNNEW